MANVFTPAIATDKAAQKRVRAWIKALRSGTYEQGKGRLREDSGYCCLGVICDLNAPGEWKDENGYGEFTHPLANGGADFGEYVLSNATRKLYRLSLLGQATLTHLNDTGSPFAEIAARLAADMRARLAA